MDDDAVGQLIGASLDLAVVALDRIGRVQLGASSLQAKL
jgi:hypothetical protein